MGQPARLFISYAHEDEDFVRRLDAHLSVLKREGLIETWNDQMIDAGTEWRSAIEEQLPAADIVLLLVSADFLASDFCYGVEMQHALERHGRGETRVLPILVRPVDFRSSPIAHLQVLPRDAKPVSTWRPQDAAWLDVIRGIRRTLESMPPKPERTPTPGVLPVGAIEEDKELDAIRILLMPSQPSTRVMEELEREGAELERGLRKSVRKGQLDLLYGWMSQPSDLLRMLHRHRPHIIHFSGHGSTTHALANADGEPLHPAEVANIFSEARGIRCVVLESCYTKPQADAIAKWVESVIAISPRAAESEVTSFASEFYSEISSGMSIGRAFELARHHTADDAVNFKLTTSRGGTGETSARPAAAGTRAVGDLLVNLFTSEELRAFASSQYDAAQFVPDGVPSIVRASAFAEYLATRGLLDADFFYRLVNVRPHRAPEIIEVARHVGSHLSEIPPPRKTTKKKPKPPRTTKIPPRPVRAHQPVRVRLLADQHDAAVVSRLERHLSPHVRKGDIVLDVQRSLPKAEPADIYKRVADTEVLVMLLSPAFLNSAAATEEATTSLLELSLRSGLTVLPVVAKDCDWHSTVFARFPVRPKESSLSDPSELADARWSEVVEAIVLICQQRGCQPLVGSPAASAKKNSYQLSDVFSTTGYPKVTFVTPTRLPDLIAELRVPGRVLVVEGPSGIGKTVAVKHALAEHGQRWPIEWLQMKLEKDMEMARALPERKLSSIIGHLVIDDFQMLDIMERVRIANFAKAFADERTTLAKITLIGINQSGQSIMQSVPDLATRAKVIRLGRDTNERILQLIEKGEEALNVHFLRKADFALAANGSFVVAQMLCEEALSGEVDETRLSLTEIPTNPATLFPEVIKSLWGQFHDRLQSFAMLDKHSPERGGPIALLWHLGSSPDGSIAIGDIRPQWPELDQSLSDALSEIETLKKAGDNPDWHALLACDPTSGQLALEDPKLGFYLRSLDWVDFGVRCGVKLKRTPEGGLQFLGKSTPTTRVAVIAAPVSEREVHLLHISDLHFSANTTWDSDTVLDRLVNDVVRVINSGKQPDVLVVTGDVANYGKAEEYELARKWIVDTLLPAAKLTTASLVMAAGNHDADRTLVTRSSSALQNELLRLKDQTEITQVLVKPQDRDVLLARHSAFVSMLNSTRAGGRIWDLPWGAVNIDVRGVRVHVAALCSSWMSSSDADKGNLLLGLSQVNEVFQGAKKADLVLAAVHHPWSYMADFDEVSRREVQRNASIVLRGHLHEADHVMQSSLAHPGLIEIAAGATYETSRYSNAYHFITVRLDEKKVRVYPRHWDTQRRDWTADLNVFQGESGELSYGTH